MQDENNYWTISLPQRMRFEEGKWLYHTVANYIDRGHIYIIADASKLEDIDSQGIGYLVSALKTIKEKGGELILRDLWGQPLDTFNVIGLTPAFVVQRGKEVKSPSESLFSESVEIKLDLSYEVSSRGLGVLHFSGVMNSPQAVRKMKEQILLACRDTKKIVLDFENLTMFDSNALGMIVSLYKMLDESGGDIIISGANDVIVSLLDSANLSDKIACYDSVEDIG